MEFSASFHDHNSNVFYDGSGVFYFLPVCSNFTSKSLGAHSNNHLRVALFCASGFLSQPPLHCHLKGGTVSPAVICGNISILKDSCDCGTTNFFLLLFLTFTYVATIYCPLSELLVDFFNNFFLFRISRAHYPTYLFSKYFFISDL